MILLALSRLHDGVFDRQPACIRWHASVGGLSALVPAVVQLYQRKLHWKVGTGCAQCSPTASDTPVMLLMQVRDVHFPKERTSRRRRHFCFVTFESMQVCTELNIARSPPTQTYNSCASTDWPTLIGYCNHPASALGSVVCRASLRMAVYQTAACHGACSNSCFDRPPGFFAVLLRQHLASRQWDV
jgi:hypothetical protein